MLQSPHSSQMVSPQSTGRSSSAEVQLIEAAQVGDPQAVQTAIKEGANLNSIDLHGWSALHYGSAGGHLTVCKVLVESSCDVNMTLPDFSTPLMLAVEEGHLSIARYLLDGGALPHRKDEDGFTAHDRCDKSIQQALSKYLCLPGSPILC